MTKYYVESGSQLKTVVSAETEFEAIVKALSLAGEEPLRLANVMIVNQRGFVWDREDQKLHGDETVIPTRLLLGEPAA